jgi:type VI secretion system secreted protein VgrG
MRVMASSAQDGLRRLEVTITAGDALDVRQFQVQERMNELFEISVVALSENPDIDFEATAGQPMSFTARKDTGEHDSRTWTGLCRHVEVTGVEERGLSAYRLVLVPKLWLLTQRRNHRMFQRESELDIARKLLSEWGIPTTEILTSTYKKREYRIQYGESDFTFLRRMLEDAGIAFYFRTEGAETRLVLSDAPDLNTLRDPAIAFRDNPTVAAHEHVTRLRFGRSIQPGKVTVRDHDHRRPPSFDLKGSVKADGGVESLLEQFEYRPGAFVFEADKGEPSPSADDRGRFRTDEKEALATAERRLAAGRGAARTVTFETNTVDLAPGTVVSFLDHPKSEVASAKGFLVTSLSLHGEPNGKWTCTCEAASAAAPYRPAVVTPKPKTSGVESATVVGPAGEEIHTDEFGRVRVHFHWDRESRMNERSSCWIHVSQPWGGAGFGGTNLPRIGQEVIVDFLGGDPDRPVIVGRLYTALQSTPYKLPDNKTQSGWQSRTSPGGGGDNYNEIMFEDKKGQELVRMQAEKDLNKLVKNDEKVKIGHDREKLVVHDDALTVGHDRSREVGHDEDVEIGHDRTRKVANDETISIGNDRTRLVGNDESITVGNNRTKSVAINETLFVGMNQNEQIGGNRSVKVKKNHSEKIGKNKTIKVGKAKTETVALTSTETVGLAKTVTVGLAKTVTVGAAYTLTVAAAHTTTVGGTMTTTVAMNQKETVGKTKTVKVADKIEIVCGKSSATLEKEGKITWAIEGGASIVLDDKNITIQAGDGGVVVIQGGPDVHVNP